jgi:hypothetical protein
MTKCKNCGRKFQGKPGLALIIAGQLGFELSMLVFGAYGTACVLLFQSVRELAFSLLLGALTLFIFYKLSKSSRVCEQCQKQA